MKVKTAFICQNCGSHSPKWMGKCPGCGEWNTLIEEVEEEAPAEFSFPPSDPVLYKDIKEAKKDRLHKSRSIIQKGELKKGKKKKKAFSVSSSLVSAASATVSAASSAVSAGLTVWSAESSLLFVSFV